MSFDEAFSAMTLSIQGNRTLSKKTKGILLPDLARERQTHSSTKSGNNCSCRVCYWSKGLTSIPGRR